MWVQMMCAYGGVVKHGNGYDGQTPTILLQGEDRAYAGHTIA
jgi:hypothetical protein